MRKLAFGISVALTALLVTGCGGGNSSGNGDGGTGQSGSEQNGAEQSLCLQRHPLLNSERLANRAEAVAAFYQAKRDCKASLSALLKQAKTMEQNGNYLE
jgi:hypothetical protein